ASRMEVQPSACMVIEDSPAGVTAATAAGMTAIGFVGGSHAGAQLGEELTRAGARAIVADLRHLKSTVVALRGWERSLARYCGRGARFLPLAAGFFPGL